MNHTISSRTNLEQDICFFFKKKIEQINLTKGLSKKIRSLHCEALKFTVVTEASLLGTESRRNNSSIIFFRKVGHYLYVTEYKFGNTNARSSGATISINSGVYIVLETRPSEHLHGSRLWHLSEFLQKKNSQLTLPAHHNDFFYFVLISSYSFILFQKNFTLIVGYWL